MRSLLNKVEQAVLLVLPLVLCAMRVTGQERRLPATGEPPEIQLMRRLPPAPEKVASQSVDQIIRRLGVSRTEIERRKASPGRALPATAKEPVEIAEVKRMERERPATAHSSPVKEILDALRRQPGGAAMLERARRGGAHIPRDGAMNFEPRNSRRTAYFASRETVGPVDEYQPTATLRVTRAAESQSVTGFGTLRAYGFFPVQINSVTTWGPLFPMKQTSATYSPVGAPYDVKSYMLIGFTATTAGYYAINVTAGASAFVARNYTSSGTYQLLASFPTPPNPSGIGPNLGTYSYPVLVNLSAGSHWFTWTNLDWVYVSEVSVVKF